MRLNSLFVILSVLFSSFAVAQEIHGKIHVETGIVSEINVVNLGTEKSTLVADNGDFSILAKLGDVLVFSSINFEIKQKKITLSDLKAIVLEIKMIPKMILLEEVVINQYTGINAVSLGIISKTQTQLSPAERRLASSGGITNLLSGRTAMLKKELVVEKKEQSLNKMKFLFEDTYYTNTLKIPVDYIKGFQYYCADDIAFSSSLKGKNKAMTQFLIIGLSEKYIKTIKNEK